MSTKTFGGRLYEIRKTYKNDKGKTMSIRQFAKFLGINFATYNKWESDTASATSSNLIDICNKCNVSADYLLGLSNESTRDLDLKAVCKYTGLSENAVKVLNDNQNQKKEYISKQPSSLEERIVSKLTEKLASEINARFDMDIKIDNEYIKYLDMLPQVISLIIEENAVESIDAGEEDSFYFLNPFSKDDANFHASELIRNIFEYISVNIPKNRYIKIDKQYHISEIECEFDEEGQPFIYLTPFPEDKEYKVKSYIYSNEYKPASEYNNQFIFDNIKEELKKLRNQYQARSESEKGNKSTKKGE